MLSKWIKAQGFQESVCDPCLYIGDDKTRVIFFHIKDLLVAGNVKEFKTKFLSKFNHSSSHKPNTLLRMKIEQKDCLIHLSLPLHIEKGIEELGLQQSQPISTPLTPGHHLSKADKEDRDKFLALKVNYCSPIGQINFIASLARPDISFAVSSQARHCEEPGMSHWNEVLKVWRYLSNTKDMTLTLGPRSVSH